MWQKGRGVGLDNFSMTMGRWPGGGSTRAVPPPPSLTVSRPGGSGPLAPVPRSKFTSETEIGNAIVRQQYAMTHNIGRKRHIDEDEWKKVFRCLERDDEEDQPQYQPAPGSPGDKKEEGDGGDSEEEDDPLDAFMAGIEVQARKDKEASAVHEKEGPCGSGEDGGGKKGKGKLGRTDIEDEDMQESYFTWLEENKPDMLYDMDDEEDIEYDQEGNPIWKKKIIDPLPDIDHRAIEYEDFAKHFYLEHKNISELNHGQVDELRNKLGIKVSGLNPSKPVTSFAHFGFEEELMSVIRKSEYSQPTPIQAQGIPLALSGRDMIGIAKTGSGKTAAYLWPAMVHIMDQRELLPGDGPIVLICVPTRELAIQVYNEAKRFGKVYNITAICAYGGGSKWEQSKALQDEGAEIVVCTPGRMIDLVKIEATNLRRVTFMVFDEADRMFDLGFEVQVRSIANHVRPDRQCLMFSATFKKRVERLARDILTDPVRVVQGDLGEANEDIEQKVIVLEAGPLKWEWLFKNLVGFCTKGKVLIFVTKKLNSEELAKNLKQNDFKLVLLHGDMLQTERNEVIHSFRKDESIPILVATDVAARGLDITSIKTVVNYDVARDIDTHVHRIGRTGRAGEKGWAYTLVTDKDKEFAGHLVKNLESVNQTVRKDLMELAMQSAWFRSNRWKSKNPGPKKPGVGGRGLGYKEGPSSSNNNTALMIKEGVSVGKVNPHGPLKSLSAPPQGDTTSRISQLRSNFAMSYQSKFTAASDTGWDKRNIPVTDPTPEWKKEESSSDTRKKKSRWD